MPRSQWKLGSVPIVTFASVPVVSFLIGLLLLIPLTTLVPLVAVHTDKDHPQNNLVSFAASGRFRSVPNAGGPGVRWQTANGGREKARHYFNEYSRQNGKPEHVHGQRMKRGEAKERQMGTSGEDDRKCLTQSDNHFRRRKFHLNKSVKADFAHVLFLFLDLSILISNKSNNSDMTNHLENLSARIEDALISSGLGRSSAFPNRYSALLLSYPDVTRLLPVGDAVCGSAEHFTAALRELSVKDTVGGRKAFGSRDADGYLALTLALALTQQCADKTQNSKTLILLFTSESYSRPDKPHNGFSDHPWPFTSSYESALSSLQVSETVLNVIAVSERMSQAVYRKNTSSTSNVLGKDFQERLQKVQLRRHDNDDYRSLSAETGGSPFVLFRSQNTSQQLENSSLHDDPWNGLGDIPQILSRQATKKTIKSFCEICSCHNRSLQCSKLHHITDESGCMSSSDHVSPTQLWTMWFPVSNCSAPCGGQGQIWYARLQYCTACCKKTVAGEISSKHPPTAKVNSTWPFSECIVWEERSVQCTGKPCPVDGRWGAWTEISFCDAPCGQIGHVELVRHCNDPPPMFGGSPCLGIQKKLKACAKSPCALCSLFPKLTASEARNNRSTKSANGSRSKRGITPYIIGGERAKANSWPWIAMLYKRSSSVAVCGGALVHREFVVTAAHCITPYIREDGRVRRSILIKLGKRRLWHGERHVQTFFIRQAVIHPKYKRSSLRNDIAILHLSKAARLSQRVKLLLVPDGRQINSTNLCLERSGTLTRLAGWGQVDAREGNSVTLQEVTLPVVNQRTCRKAFAAVNIVTAKMICLGNGDGQTDACRGDSGGPVVARNPLIKKWVLIGLVSWGSDHQGCAQKNRFTVATRTSKYYGWIRTVMARLT